ncbi:RagB/SusD family nutrient uptake outer membrane protein [Cyclobacterium sp. 1_MG-2023]|uniref:RagB/SusD family nutrient uptake outer membrane protein n=1 Tax=Cyclobacterium sp. 1_MG-2023 TaxID=3062681 RepID=UPI0026E3C5A7|nr:RagB/SusD family nutrient uptake outer membrane protein [Cyclobacterium sp. 1_MG-2023]MDO6439569.1 RagB/SusD family nutrient uptake outer membrane protein [Cyclobacterium sp. 1_MG-2023]
MKSILKRNWILIIFLPFLFISCEDYLDRTPEADITEEDIFGTFESYMGYTDYNYAEVVDLLGQYAPYVPYWGGEGLFIFSDKVTAANKGEYWTLIGRGLVNYYWVNNRPRVGEWDYFGEGGIWYGGWRGIRRANTALLNIDMLQGSEEQKDIIKGQSYFFRAWFHQQIIEGFGGMPYADVLFEGSDVPQLPRLSYQETAERIDADMDKAIELLPVNWDNTVLGQDSPGTNTGRITKGAALALKGRFLLFAASPLMNGFSTNDFNYNEDLSKRSAAASWEVIKMADEGVYSLVPWEDYGSLFHNNNDGTNVWTTETLWLKPTKEIGSLMWSTARLHWHPNYLGAEGGMTTASQNFVDRFEMADGSRYQVAYDQDDNKRWEDRDPRFKVNIAVDRDKVGDNISSVWHGYVGDEPTARPGNQAASTYLIKKFIPYGMNTFDNEWRNYQFRPSLIRLAEVYLNYAEAVTAAYGPLGSAPGANLTAVDAINIIRERAGMPPVTAEATGYDSFMDLVRNERSVELAFEGNGYWVDIRRWYIGHLQENKPLYTLDFDKEWTYFNRNLHTLRVFDNPKHYWLPIYREQVQLYPEFEQNPGW